MLDIEQARKICETEKSGCWTIQQGEYYTEIYDISNSSRPFAAISDKNKAEFIAFARNALPEALHEIEKLEMQLRIKLDEEYPEGSFGYIVQQLLEEQRKLTCSGYPAMQVSKEILSERLRQIGEEEFSAERDDKYFNEELSMAAACYALTDEARDCIVSVENLCLKQYEKGLLKEFIWPFKKEWWKPSPDNRRRELIKAAALIIAEIERLDRKESGKNARL